MATYTTFLNLEKPTTSERLDVLKINANWDKIDAGVSALNAQISTVTTAQIAVNSSKVTSGTLDITTCRKTGKFVSVAARVHSITDGTVTATGVFFTVPDGFRPAANTYGYAYLNIDGGFVPVFASIGTNGEVQINYSGSRYATQAFFCASYVV